MSAGRRVCGALLGVLVAYLLMVAAMAVVTYVANSTSALKIAAYAFPIMLAALAVGWWKADALTRPFSSIARRWRR